MGAFAGAFPHSRGYARPYIHTDRQRPRRYFMASFLDPWIAFVAAHPWLAYLTLFLAALLEAVPVLGAVIPGSTIILALSALVPGGELRLGRCWRPRSPGAMLGDGMAFWIGHRAQRKILSSWPLSNYPRLIAQSEAFFHRWGTLAVFFRALRAADTRLRADHGGRARHAAAALLCRQHPGDPAMGGRPCAAGRAGGIRAARIRRHSASHRDRQALLDIDGDRRRAGRLGGRLDHPPQARPVLHDLLAAGLRPGAGPI